MTPSFEADGRPVTAAQFYAIACAPERDVVVEACAGAGKTWMLVARIVRILLSGVKAHEILALTFTKKAAAEMRNRIYAELEALAHMDDVAILAYLAERGLASEQALAQGLVAQAKALYAALLAQPKGLSVLTFHAWFSTLVQGAPWQFLDSLGLPCQYSVVEKTESIIAKTWPRFWQRMDAQDSAALRLKENWFALVASRGHHSSMELMRTVLYRQGEFRAALQAGVLEHSILPWQAQFASYAQADSAQAAWLLPWVLDCLEQAHAVLCRSAKKTERSAAAGLASGLASLRQGESEAGSASVWAAMRTKQGLPRKFSDLAEVATAQDCIAALRDIALQEQAHTLQAQMLCLGPAFLECYREQKHAEGLLDMADLEYAAQALLAHSDMAAWVQERLDGKLRHVLIDEFQDTNPVQWQALHSWLSAYAGAGGGSGLRVFVVGDPKQSIYRFRGANNQVFEEAKTFVRQGLQGTILGCDHSRRCAPALIDVLNASFPALVASGASTAHPAHRFVYRPHSTAVAAPSAGLASGVFCLPYIERQGKKGPETDAESDAAPVPSAMDIEAAVGVQVDSDWRDSFTSPKIEDAPNYAEQEMAQLAVAIKNLVHAGQDPGQIMVLARKRKSLELARTALRSANIPAYIDEKSALADALEVQDIIALLDCLCSPQDDLALAKVLKSPLFGLEDQALVSLAQAAQKPIPPLSNAAHARPDDGHDDDSDDSGYADGVYADDYAGAVRAAEIGAAQQQRRWWAVLREEHAPIAATLQRWRDWLQRLPPHDALQAIFSTHQVIDRYQQAAPPALRQRCADNLRALLWTTLGWQEGRYLSAYAWVRAMKNQFAAATMPAPAQTPQGSVALYTVHGAKGLEADIVFLIDCHAQRDNQESKNPVLMDWPASASAPQCFAFLASASAAAPSLRAQLEKEKDAQNQEAHNLLYVAMTRARRCLVLSATQPYTQDERFAWWQTLAEKCTPLQANNAHILCTHAPVPGLGRVDENAGQMGNENAEALSIEQAYPALGIAMQQTTPVADDLAQRLGQGLHRLLEWGPDGIAWNKDPLLPVSVARYMLRHYRLDAAQSQQIWTQAYAMRSGEAAWVWDAHLLAWAGNEVDILVQGRWLRIDRLVQTKSDQIWWVLDFKSAADPSQDPTNRAQLASYRSAVAALHPQATVRAAFITGTGAMLNCEM